MKFHPGLNAGKHIHQPPPSPPWAHMQARWMCRGGLRIVGLITRGQVLDWCPPAVLFYPIRNSICCPTQLLSGHTSHPHRWEHVVFLCASLCLPLLLLSSQTTRRSSERQRAKFLSCPCEISRRSEKKDKPPP